MATDEKMRVACGRCEGTGGHNDFGQGEQTECVTCAGTGEVNSYGSLKVSSGGVTVEVTAYGHREMSDDAMGRAFDGIDGDSPPRKCLDQLLREVGPRARGEDG